MPDPVPGASPLALIRTPGMVTKGQARAGTQLSDPEGRRLECPIETRSPSPRTTDPILNVPAGVRRRGLAGRGRPAGRGCQLLWPEPRAPGPGCPGQDGAGLLRETRGGAWWGQVTRIPSGPAGLRLRWVRTCWIPEGGQAPSPGAAGAVARPSLVCSTCPQSPTCYRKPLMQLLSIEI